MKTSTIRFILLLVLVSCLGLISCENKEKIEKTMNTFSVDINFPYPSEHYGEELDGRLILLISDSETSEPRFQLRDDSKTCQGFGMDVENWKTDQVIQFDVDAFGYPIRSFEDLPQG